MAAPAVVISSRSIETAELEDQDHGHEHEEARPAPPPAGRRRGPVPRSSAGRATFGSRRRHPDGSVDRPDRSETGHSNRQPSAGSAAGIPVFPEPLPGSDHYRPKQVIPDSTCLDTGPAEAYYAKGMAHGVPAPPVHGGKPAPDAAERHAIEAARAEKQQLARQPVDPVPVYIVETGGGTRPLKRAALRQVTVQAAGADPQEIVPRNPRRSSVRLLNESATVAVRLTFDLTTSGGALLPAAMTSYLEIDTEDQVCAYSTGAAAAVSVIEQYDVPGGT